MQKYQTAPESRGVYYYMDDYLHLKLIEKSMLSSKKINYLEVFEHQIEASFFYPLFFAHLNILISILCGAKSEIAICASLVVGFIIGTLLSLSANFVFYLLPINKIMTFYNFINKYFVVDIALFFVYIFVVKKWWTIFVHIGIFAVLCFLKGALTTHARENFSNKLAEKWLDDDSGNIIKTEKNKSSESTEAKYDSKNNGILIKVIKKYILVSCLVTVAGYVLLLILEIIKGNTKPLFIADLLIELIISLPLNFITLLLPEILIRYKSIKKPTTKIIAFLISLAHYILYSIVFSFLCEEFIRYGLWWLLLQCKIMTEQQECSDTQEEYKEPYIDQNGKHFTEPAEELPIIHEKTIDTDISADEARLSELNEELKKIPVAKVKKWHEEGKLTDEQYKSIARKYNTMLKERDEIQERMELLKNIDE